MVFITSSFSCHNAAAFWVWGCKCLGSDRTEACPDVNFQECRMTSLQPEFASFQFSTRELDPDRRVAAWNSEFGRTRARRMLAPGPANARPFHLNMKGCCLGRRAPAGHSVEVMQVAVTASG